MSDDKIPKPVYEDYLHETTEAERKVGYCYLFGKKYTVGKDTMWIRYTEATVSRWYNKNEKM